MNRLHALALGAIGFAALSQPAVAASDGASLYGPCKACHLATGKGVPGAFPPLKQQIVSFAASDEGRAYLALIVKRGGIGRIKVDGQTYIGAMPAQARLKPGEIATLLNYVATDIAGGAGVTAFTEEEVDAILKAHPKARGSKVIAMRPDPAAQPAAAPEPAAIEAPQQTSEEPKEEKAAANASAAPVTEADKRWEAHLKQRAEGS